MLRVERNAVRTEEVVEGVEAAAHSVVELPVPVLTNNRDTATRDTTTTGVTTTTKEVTKEVTVVTTITPAVVPPPVEVLPLAPAVAGPVNMTRKRPMPNTRKRPSSTRVSKTKVHAVVVDAEDSDVVVVVVDNSNKLVLPLNKEPPVNSFPVDPADPLAEGLREERTKMPPPQRPLSSLPTSPTNSMKKVSRISSRITPPSKPELLVPAEEARDSALFNLKPMISNSRLPLKSITLKGPAVS